MTKKNEQNEVKKVHVYLRDPTSVWLPAIQLLTSDNGTKATVTVPEFKNEQDTMGSGGANVKLQRDNQVVDLTKYDNNVLPMQNVDSHGHLEEYKDMVGLPFLHEVRKKTTITCIAPSRFRFPTPCPRLVHV
jgi:hypothetical protein